MVAPVVFLCIAITTVASLIDLRRWGRRAAPVNLIGADNSESPQNLDRAKGHSRSQSPQNPYRAKGT